MSNEERIAIEYWKTHMEILHWNTQLASEHYIKVLLDLIEKQQKEIKELKEKNKFLDWYFENQKENFIHKDKIKAKIEFIKSLKEKIYYEENVISVLQSLLEKE